VAAGGPHLLAGDDPLVAVLDGAALQAGEVRTRTRLAEELAPGPLAGDDVAHHRVDLLLRAVRGDRRRGEEEPEATGGAEGAEVGDGLLHGHRVVAGQALAVGVLGQVRGGPARHAPPPPPLTVVNIGNTALP